MFSMPVLTAIHPQTQKIAIQSRLNLQMTLSSCLNFSICSNKWPNLAEKEISLCP
jgi:hypothetical protein